MKKISYISILLTIFFAASINAIDIPSDIVSDDSIIVRVGDRFILPSNFVYEYTGADPITASNPKIRMELVGLLLDDGTIISELYMIWLEIKKEKILIHIH